MRGFRPRSMTACVGRGSLPGRSSRAVRPSWPNPRLSRLLLPRDSLGLPWTHIADVVCRAGFAPTGEAQRGGLVATLEPRWAALRPNEWECSWLSYPARRGLLLAVKTFGTQRAAPVIELNGLVKWNQDWSFIVLRRGCPRHEKLGSAPTGPALRPSACWDWQPWPRSRPSPSRSPRTSRGGRRRPRGRPGSSTSRASISSIRRCRSTARRGSSASSFRSFRPSALF